MGLHYTSRQKYMFWLRENCPKKENARNFDYREHAPLSFFDPGIERWECREAVPVPLDARQVRDIDEYMEIIRTKDIPRSAYDMLLQPSGPSGSPYWFTEMLRDYLPQEWINELHRYAHTYCRGHVDSKLDAMKNVVFEAQEGIVRNLDDGKRVIRKIYKRHYRAWKRAMYIEKEGAQYRQVEK